MKQLLNRLFVMIMMISSMNYVDASNKSQSKSPLTRSNSKSLGLTKANDPTTPQSSSFDEYIPTEADLAGDSNFYSPNATPQEQAAFKAQQQIIQQSTGQVLSWLPARTKTLQQNQNPISELDLNQSADSTILDAQNPSQPVVLTGTVIQKSTPTQAINAKKPFTALTRYDENNKLQTLDYQSDDLNSPHIQINYLKKSSNIKLQTPIITVEEVSYPLSLNESTGKYSTAMIPNNDYLVQIEYNPTSQTTGIREFKYKSGWLGSLQKPTLINESWYDSKGKQTSAPKTNYQIFVEAVNTVQKNLPVAQQHLQRFQNDPNQYIADQISQAVTQAPTNDQSQSIFEQISPTKIAEKLTPQAQQALNGNLNSVAQQGLQALDQAAKNTMQPQVASQAPSVLQQIFTPNEQTNAQLKQTGKQLNSAGNYHARKLMNEQTEQLKNQRAVKKATTPDEVDISETSLFTVEPATKKSAVVLLNAGLQTGAEVVNDALINPSETSILTDDTHKAFGRVVNTAVGQTADAIAAAAIDSREEQQTTNESTSPYALTATTQGQVQTAKKELLTTGIQKGTEAVVGLLKPETLAAKQKLAKTQTELAAKQQKAKLEELKNQTLLTNTDAFSTTNQPSVATKETVASYLTSTLQASAKAVRNSPDKLGAFVENTINAFSRALGLSPKETIKLQQNAKKEVTIIKKSNSWFYKTDDAAFNQTFNTWMKSLVTKLNDKFGKSNPTELEIIQIDHESTDPLTPKISIVKNNADPNKTAATVEYNGNSYEVDASAITINAQGDCIITTDLYPEGNKETLWNSLFYKPTVKNIGESLQSSRAGRQVEGVVPGLIKKGVDSLQPNPTSDGKLTITIDANNNISTSIDKPGIDQISQQPSGTITSIKKYTSGDSAVQSQTIELTGPDSQPTVKIDYDLTSQNPAQAIKSATLQQKDLKAAPIAIEPKSITFENGIYKMTVDDFQQPQPTIETIKQQIVDAMPDYLQSSSKTILDAFHEKSIREFESFIDNLGSKDFVTNGLQKLGFDQTETIQAIQKAALQAKPTGTNTMIIEINPSTNQIATRVIKNMSDGTLEKSDQSYTM